MEIGGLPLPIRTVNALNRAKITTLDQLQTLSIQELTQIRGIGVIGIQALISICEQHSIHIPLEPTHSFSRSTFIRSLSHKTIILFHEINISTLEELPMHSTEELVQWCNGDIFRASKIYKELKSAGIATHPSHSPFLFEISSFPSSSISSLLWHGIYRMEDFLIMSEEDLYRVRNIGKKRVEQLLLFQNTYRNPFNYSL